ncbi:MAG: class I SAM-dependent methyltransferase [Actinomycetota bacterium]
MPEDRRDLRRLWETDWEEHAGPEFPWHLDEPPSQLRELVERGGLPDGAVLDLGCGYGVATAYLARFFRPAVGVDIAFGAVRQARRLASQKGAPVTLVIAEAPVLPFRAGAFALIFDRGCLQVIPKESWHAYFLEVDRLLRSGGVFQLLASKSARPSVLSVRGVKSRIRRIVSGGMGGGPQFASYALIARLLPASMETVVLEQFPYGTSTERVRHFLHGIFRKT